MSIFTNSLVLQPFPKWMWQFTNACPICSVSSFNSSSLSVFAPSAIAGRAVLAYTEISFNILDCPDYIDKGEKNHIWLHGLQTFENMIFVAYIYSCVCWCNTSYSRNSISFCLVSVAENCKHKFKSLQIELRIFKKTYSLDMALRSQITQDWQRIVVYMMRAEITIRVITIRMHLYTSPAVFFIVID